MEPELLAAIPNRASLEASLPITAFPTGSLGNLLNFQWVVVVSSLDFHVQPPMHVNGRSVGHRDRHFIEATGNDESTNDKTER